MIIIKYLLMMDSLRRKRWISKLPSSFEIQYFTTNDTISTFVPIFTVTLNCLLFISSSLRHNYVLYSFVFLFFLQFFHPCIFFGHLFTSPILYTWPYYILPLFLQIPIFSFIVPTTSTSLLIKTLSNYLIHFSSSYLWNSKFQLKCYLKS